MVKPSPRVSVGADIPSHGFNSRGSVALGYRSMSTMRRERPVVYLCLQAVRGRLHDHSSLDQFIIGAMTAPGDLILHSNSSGRSNGEKRQGPK